MTLSRTGARVDIDATVVCSYGGADRLSEHNTPNGDCVSRCYGVATFAVYSVYKRGGLRGYGMTI